MASLKPEKPLGSQQPAGQAKKEPAKACDCGPKAPASGVPLPSTIGPAFPASGVPVPSSTTTRPAPKKVEQKPREPVRKATGVKPAGKN